MPDDGPKGLLSLPDPVIQLLPLDSNSALNLSLTCKHLSEVVEPLLFRRITFHRTRYPAERKVSRLLMKLLATLIRYPHLRKHVRGLEIMWLVEGVFPENESLRVTALPDSVLTKFIDFDHIPRRILTRIQHGNEVYVVLGILLLSQNLENLHLDVPDRNSCVFDSPSYVRLRSVSLSFPYDYNDWPECESDHLELISNILQLDTIRELFIEYLSVDNDHCLPWPLSSPMSNLRRLGWSGVCAPVRVLRKVLDVSPKLEALHLRTRRSHCSPAHHSGRCLNDMFNDMFWNAFTILKEVFGDSSANVRELEVHRDNESVSNARLIVTINNPPFLHLQQLEVAWDTLIPEVKIKMEHGEPAEKPSVARTEQATFRLLDILPHSLRRLIVHERRVYRREISAESHRSESQVCGLTRSFETYLRTEETRPFWSSKEWLDEFRIWCLIDFVARREEETQSITIYGLPVHFQNAEAEGNFTWDSGDVVLSSLESVCHDAGATLRICEAQDEKKQRTIFDEDVVCYED